MLVTASELQVVADAVDRREPAQLAERFRKQDVNHDGYLSAKELAAPPQ